MSDHVVGMYMPERNEAAERARQDLASALGGATVAEPTRRACSRPASTIVFAEHPDLPEHWRARSSAPR